MSKFTYIGTVDPTVAPPNNEERTYYNMANDTLWHFYEYDIPSEEPRWMLSISNASQFDEDLAHIRSLDAPPKIFDIDMVMTRVSDFYVKADNNYA